MSALARPASDPAAGPQALLRIGAVAMRLGVSERTLRYYEEIGLLTPSGHSPGGSRRYAQRDLDRVVRIRELQSLMGFNLEEIHAVLSTEDRLEGIRAEWRRSGEPARHRELLEKGLEAVEEMQSEVRSKIQRLSSFLEELDAKARRYR
ncbi:MAG: MerR family transcriptional regulator, partial [Acidimicrobiales bacterium]